MRKGINNFKTREFGHIVLRLARAFCLCFYISLLLFLFSLDYPSRQIFRKHTGLEFDPSTSEALSRER